MTRNTKYTVVLFTLALSIQLAFSQKPVRKYYYRQLTGPVDKSTSLCVNLVRMNDSLYGVYSFQASKNGDVIDPQYLVSSVVFCGKVIPGGSFVARCSDVAPAREFSGRFTDDQHVTVALELKPGSGKRSTIQLAEKYPAGSIPFTLQYLRDQKKLISEAKSPEASIRFALLVAAGKTPAIVIDSVNRNLQGKFADREARAESPEKLLQDLRQDFFDDYINGNQMLYREMPGASYEWTFIRSTYIYNNANNRLCFGIMGYSFTGGAHGLETHMFTTIDLKTGRTVRLHDLFKAGYEDELSSLLTAKLHRMSNLPASRKLSEAGYFTERIEPTGNFFVDANGIGFTYNHYEIAPYSFGITDIYLTYAELKGILK